MKKDKLKQVIKEEIRKVLKETQYIDDFFDILLDMAIEHNILKNNEEVINSDKVRDALHDVWDEMGFEDYKEVGQGISTSDYNRALDLFNKKLNGR